VKNFLEVVLDVEGKASFREMIENLLDLCGESMQGIRRIKAKRRKAKEGREIRESWWRGVR